MKVPFVYGKIASEENFTNRIAELHRIRQNFESLTNTILISPRRWGKSSLVKKAAEKSFAHEANIRFCFIDLYSVRTEEQFYVTLAREVLKATNSKFENILEDARHFLAQLMPKITFGADPHNDISLSLDIEETMKSPDDIINLAENIARSRNLKLIVCIDEFQNLSVFTDPLAVQKRLRAAWQNHTNVGYCLYGSKRQMLMDVFTSPKMPFYNFGDIIFLEKIKTEEWIDFIMSRFKKTGKMIDDKSSELIVSLVGNHPYYVQQLSQQSWMRTQYICDEQIVKESYESLVLQMSLLFQNQTDRLSNTQVSFLEAMLNGEEQLNSQRVMIKYNLGTSGNIMKIKKALTDKEIIDIESDKINFIDPLYQGWLKKYYFRINE